MTAWQVWLLICCLAAIFTAAGAVLFPIAKRTVEETQEGAGFLPFGWYVATMGVCHLTMALFLWGFYRLAPFDIARTLLCCAVLWPCAWSDRQAFIISNRVLLLGCMLCGGVLATGMLLDPSQAGYLLLDAAAAMGCMLAASLLCRLVSPRSVGMGDVKLLAVMGLCLGMDLVWGALFFGFLLLFCYSVFLLVTKRASRNDSIPFAPFLLAGTVMGAFLTGI